MAIPSNRFSPNLTALEDRCCPSASVFAQDHTLYITTDPSSDIVQIVDDGHGHVSALVREGNLAFRVEASGIDSIVMHLRGGHDWVAIESPAPLEHHLALKIDMGRGNADKLYLGFTRGLGQGSLDVDLRGSLGHSAVDAVVGSIGQGRFDLHQHLADAQTSSHTHIQASPAAQERIYIA
jgi:hypothetical protein